MIRVVPATAERWADVVALFEGQRLDVGFSYVGFTPMFEAAGFATVVETTARSAGRPRWLMRLDLAG